ARHRVLRNHRTLRHAPKPPREQAQRPAQRVTSPPNREETHKDDLRPARQPRANVISEVGEALQAKPDRLILVQIGDVRIPSNWAGRQILRLDNTFQRRQALVERLHRMGCPVSWQMPWGDPNVSGSFDS
ncbi:MAG: hypothetical protein ABSG64_06255, partial [Solirubrobacteraceae bacterium]